MGDKDLKKQIQEEIIRLENNKDYPLTMECLISKKKNPYKPITDEEKKELFYENKNKNYSYLKVLNEIFFLYDNVSVDTLLSARFTRGFKLFTLKKITNG